jgi:hypothetical protein
MIDSLAEKLKMRVGYFGGHATNARIFENQFRVELSDTLEKLQFE